MASAGRGSGWFLGGSIVLIAFGAVHLLAVFTPPEPGAMELVAALKAYRVPMGPIELSAWDAQQILSMSYTVFLFFAGGAGVLMRGPVVRAGVLRRFTSLYLGLSVTLAVITVVWLFPPPLVFAVAASVCFGVSLLRQARSIDSRAL